MIKYFCDKCGKEIKFNIKTNITYSSLYCE